MKWLVYHPEAFIVFWIIMGVAVGVALTRKGK